MPTPTLTVPDADLFEVANLWAIPVAVPDSRDPVETAEPPLADSELFAEFLRFPEAPQRATWILGQPLWRFDEAA